MKNKKIIIVGGGLSGLMSAMKIANDGTAVDIFSLVTVKRSNSVCAQGGINAVLNTKGENDSIAEHFDDTIYGGDFLANQTPVKNMVENAPNIIYEMDRLGVLFSRDEDGKIDLRNFGGVKKKRTAFAGSTTGQQLLYALDEQIRRLEYEGKVCKFEQYEFLQVILDDNGTCRGIVAQDMNTMKIKSFAADAVIIATGGAGGVYGKSTNSMTNTGSAATILYRQGVGYANAEFVQFHPTAMLGEDKTRLMSESARGEGGRIYTIKDGKPWYFLEEWYPDYKNLVPRDIASRAIHKVCTEMGLGIDGKNQVYLDVSHLDDDFLNKRLGGIIEIYEKFYGENPRKVPMKIYPAAHYFMGGLLTNFDHSTNIKGLFAAGECDFMYHGANRLGANSLLSAIHSGTVVAPSALKYIEHAAMISDYEQNNIENKAVSLQESEYRELLKKNGSENKYEIYEQMGKIMTDYVGVIRNNKDLQKADNELKALILRFENISVSNDDYSNSDVLFARRLRNMLDLARIITVSALNRNESRGAHFKVGFETRNDEDFLKTTVAKFDGQNPVISFEDVDTSHIKPRSRKY